MKLSSKPFVVAALGLLLGAVAVRAQPAGLSSRLPNTTLTLPQQPPTFGYAVTSAFPVMVTNPIAFATPPGETNRLFILERNSGIVVAITNLAVPNRTVVMNLNSVSNRIQFNGENGLLGIAFHPGFATNRYFYLFYSMTNFATTAGTGLHQRVARFEMTATNNNVALLSSELALITQRDQANNHNGGDIHFGPDGYLYISLGDEGGQNDQNNNSQTVRKDFFSGILRIDVDKRATNLPPNPHAALMGVSNYFVPSDNPWVSGPPSTDTNTTGQVRTEFFAIGLRNPWRMSFDHLGNLWVGDVGGVNAESREEVNLVVKGGNYGWAFREGYENGPKSAQAPGGFTQVGPVTFYPRSGTSTLIGASITGGRVYRGTRLSQLFNQYVFSDYVSGNMWALTPNGTNYVSITNTAFLIDSDAIAAFGEDPRNGDLLLAYVQQSGTNAVRRLIYNNTPTGSPLPATLANVGAFTNFTLLTPHAGIVPYSVNVPFWSDNALKSRWFSIPNPALDIGYHITNAWSFPTGTVWIKHFDLVTNHLTQQRTRLETRFLVRNPNGVYGVTYRWGGQTNATLVAEEGTNETFVITDPGGILRTQVWRYPSRSECLACHNSTTGDALGMHTAQLNRLHTYTNLAGATGVTDNQLRALNAVGYFTPGVSNLNLLPAMADWDDTSASLEWRVRSYLMANCASCHVPGGVGLGSWDARYHVPTALAGIIHGPLNNDFGNTNSRVIVPGSPTNSMLYQRMGAFTGSFMPPVATRLIDTNALNLFAAWIGSPQLTSYQTFAQWQMSNFGSTVAPNAQPGADPDGDGLTNEMEHQLGTNPNEASSDWKISIQMNGTNAQVVFPHLANRGFEVLVRTNLQVVSPWLPLDVPDNVPFFPSVTFTNAVEDVTGSGTNKTYRVRVFSP